MVTQDDGKGYNGLRCHRIMALQGVYGDTGSWKGLGG